MGTICCYGTYLYSRYIKFFLLILDCVKGKGRLAVAIFTSYSVKKRLYFIYIYLFFVGKTNQDGSGEFFI